MYAEQSDTNRNDLKETELKYSSSIMGPLHVKRVRQRKEELENLATEFAAHKVSAAGISYIVNSRSAIRRLLWFIGVLICTVFMGYMTIKVMFEYLSYPKMLIKEDIILTKLEFPAVTVCSLNPISSQTVRNTSLQKFLELKNMLKNATPRRYNSTMQRKCKKNQLCKWSWFKEVCNCAENPCLTEFCLAHNSSHCTCSESFCQSNTRISTCKLYPSPVNESLTKDECVCEGTSTQEFIEYASNATMEDIQELLDSIENVALREMLRVIKTSETYDLVDVEEALMPPTSELYAYGSSFDDLIASCSYEGTHCHRENFTVLYHPNYGKCFMFNYIGKGTSEIEKPIHVHSYGSNSGLQLILRVTDRNTLGLLRREIGARIVIHAAQSLPFVAEYGVNVRPRDMSAVELSLSTLDRLGKPWGNCQDNSRRMYNGDPYSILGCEKVCGYEHMTKHCNCTMRHLLRGSVLAHTEPPHRLCDISNATEKECAIRATGDIERRNECDCRPPCKETIYSYSVTSSELNQNYFKTVKAVRTLIRDSDGKIKYFNSSDDKSMVGVKVYFNTFQISHQREVAYYSWETLVANIGGNLGFFMGLTLVTFMEITEFLWDFIATALSCTTSTNKVHTLQAMKHKARIRIQKRRKLKSKERRQTL